MLKAEYEAGKRGDDAPVTPLWASPKEQLDAVVALLRSARDDAPAAPAPAPTDPTDPTDPIDPIDPVAAAAPTDEDVAAVTSAMRGVDWAAVRVATTERGADATRVMRTMADQVDWSKVQPVAGQVTSALIAAVASGQLPVGGRLGSTVARAIVDQGGLGQRVTLRVTADAAHLPPDFRPDLGRPTAVIDVTASEVDPPATSA